jgi:hypothetical protein
MHSRRGAQRATRRARFPAACAAAALLAIVGGCCGRSGGVGDPPRDAEHALERANQHLGRLTGTVQSRALVSFSFRDGNGTMRRFIGHDAAMIFRAPRCLIFDVRSLGGTIAQFGSNDARYWVWIEPDTPRLWWGRWDSGPPDPDRRLPIAPGDLLDALMLRPLPAALPNSLGALLRVDGGDHRLLYVRHVAGYAVGLREIRLQPTPPHLPAEIVDRGADGRVLMHAEIGRYEAAGPGGTRVPRRYVIRWPADEAELRIDFTSVRLTELEDFCDFPSGFRGAVEQIDAPHPAPASADQ